MLKKLLKILLALLVIVVIFAFFVKHEGIQRVLVFVTHSYGNPFFEATGYVATPNCAEQGPCTSGTIRVISFNVLCRACAMEGYEAWDSRLPELRALIAKHAPDLIGFQELVGREDFEDLLGAEHGYQRVSYELGGLAYGDCGLLFRKERFELLESGQFWLSPKPDLPLSFGWQALSVPRYVNWAYLRQRSNGFRFLFVNTHFDNNMPNKKAAARLFAQTFKPIAEQVPMVVTGDFNTPRSAERYQWLLHGDGAEPYLTNTRELAEETLVNQGLPEGKTAAQTAGFIDAEGLIDHILVGGPGRETVKKWELECPVYGPNYYRPSDHPMVYAEIILEDI